MVLCAVMLSYHLNILISYLYLPPFHVSYSALFVPSTREHSFSIDVVLTISIIILFDSRSLFIQMLEVFWYDNPNVSAAFLYDMSKIDWSLWRHQMEIYSALLAICAGNSPVPQWPVTRSFDVFFDLRPNKRLSKQWWGWWFETPSSPLWRHWNVLEENKPKQSMNRVRKALVISSLFVNWCHCCHIDCDIYLH